MKKIISLVIWSLAIGLIGIESLYAQNTNNFKEQFSQHFDYASRVLPLAKAMPADKYSWRPNDKVYSVERVFTHIARYNFYYLENSLAISPPDDVDVENMESITGKEEVVKILERSIEHVKESR